MFLLEDPLVIMVLRNPFPKSTLSLTHSPYYTWEMDLESYFGRTRGWETNRSPQNSLSFTCYLLDILPISLALQRVLRKIVLELPLQSQLLPQLD